MMAGSGREIPKGKLSLIVSAHHPVKETNPTIDWDNFGKKPLIKLLSRKSW